MAGSPSLARGVSRAGSSEEHGPAEWPLGLWGRRLAAPSMGQGRPLCAGRCSLPAPAECQAVGSQVPGGGSPRLCPPSAHTSGNSEASKKRFLQPQKGYGENPQGGCEARGRQCGWQGFDPSRAVHEEDIPSPLLPGPGEGGRKATKAQTVLSPQPGPPGPSSVPFRSAEMPQRALNSSPIAQPGPGSTPASMPAALGT